MERAGLGPPGVKAGDNFPLPGIRPETDRMGEHAGMISGARPRCRGFRR